MEMKLKLLSIAIMLILINNSQTIFLPTGNATLQDDLLDVQYTNDQKYAILAFQDYAQIRNGVTMQLLQQIQFDDGETFSTLAVSQDETKFAIGFANQGGTTYFVIYLIDQTNHKVKDKKLVQANALKSQITGTVNTLCFNADNTYVALGTSNGDIGVWLEQDVSMFATKFGDSIPITSIACSSFRSLQFTVAGGLKDTSKKLTTYNFDPINQLIEELKNYNQIDQGQVIFDIVYHPEGMEIYRVGSNNYIYIDSIDQQESDQIMLPAEFKNIHKIRLSQKGNIIALSNGQQIWIRKQTPNEKNGYEYQNYTSRSPAFALSSKGANIIYINANNTGQVLGQCPNSWYLNDETDQCDQCDSACTLCLDGPEFCYSCHQGHYLQSYQCLACVQNCKVCSNGQECEICNDPFLKDQQNLCVCKKGFFIDEDTCTQCQQGCLECLSQEQCTQCAEGYQLDNNVCQVKSPRWEIIILLILIAGLAFVIISVILLKMKKKYSKKSQLLSDHQDLTSSL